jgi:uncharacterized membrane protein
MAFIDNLALVELLIALAASLLAYSGVLVWWAMRQNDPKGVRGVLRGLSVPLGVVGVATLLLALWGEMIWPFPAAIGMGGYNIFFFDPLLLFGIVLTGYAVSAHLGVKMQYVGFAALVFGAATMFYGWTGWTASPAFTKEPFDTFLLYMGFGAAGVFAFPTSVAVDYYLACAEKGLLPFSFGTAVRAPSGERFGTRGVQPLVPVPKVAPAEEASPSPVYHFPYWAQLIVLLFPLFAALAAIAAFWYFGTTLPGHLGTGPGGAP